MMWVVITLVVLLLLLPVLVGLLLSPYQQVTRVELIKAPADAVWNALNDFSQQGQWRDDLVSMQMLDDDDGLRWVEQVVAQRPRVLRKLKALPLKELLVEMQQRNNTGTRHARLNAVPGGTRVTFTEMLETRNPLERIRERMGSRLDQRLDHFIHQLKTHFGA